MNRKSLTRTLLAAGVAAALSTMVVLAPNAQAAIFDASGCAAGRSLQVVAHEDDDLLFINPEIQRDIDYGRCTLTVFMTAGDAGRGEAYWRERENGPRAAYALMADADDSWTATTRTFGSYKIDVETLDGHPETALAFVRAPDGGSAGFAANNYESLNAMYLGTLSQVHSVDGVSTYTRAGLIDMLVDVMNSFQPTTIRTTDYSDRNKSNDHNDHKNTSYLTREAHQRYLTPHTLEGYLAYSISSLPLNLMGPGDDRKMQIFMAYVVHDPAGCQTIETCVNGSYDIYSFRTYKISGEAGGGQNVLPFSTVSASTATAANPAVRAVDNVISGHPMTTGKEWVTVAGKAGSWISGTFLNPQTVDRFVLYDRPNDNDQVTSGTLSFNNGTSIAVGTLPNTGEGKVITFAPRQISSWKFTVGAVSATTVNIGLAEIQAYATTIAPQATVTASSQNTATSQQAAKAVDGYTAGTGIYSLHEWATVGGKANSWLKLAWRRPQTIDRVVLYDRANANDQVTGGTLTFSDGSTVTVPALPNTGTGYTVTFPARTVTDLTFTVTTVSTTTLNVGLSEIQVEKAP